MARRIKCQLGDVFMIPLEEGLYGVGRILRKNVDTILVELYRMSPIRDKSEYDFEKVSEKEPITMEWMYDTEIWLGNWKIIDNQPAPEHIDMPYFWHQDFGDMKYYIRKGSEQSHDTIGERKEISKADIENYTYSLSGIADGRYIQIVYMRRLKYVGLM